MSDEEPKKKKMILMEVNEATTIWNLIAIPMIFGACTMAVSFYNPNVVYLLRNKEYFNLADSEVSRINSQVVLYSLIVSTAVSVFCGQIYDILGRRGVIIANIALLGLVVITVPFCAPSLTALTFNRIGMGVFSHFLYGNPLIPDAV